MIVLKRTRAGTEAFPKEDIDLVGSTGNIYTVSETLFLVYFVSFCTRRAVASEVLQDTFCININKVLWYGICYTPGDRMLGTQIVGKTLLSAKIHWPVRSNNFLICRL